MTNYLENKTYFPIMKLMYIIARLNTMESKKVITMKFLKSLTEHESENEKRTSDKEDNSKRTS